MKSVKQIGGKLWRFQKKPFQKLGNKLKENVNAGVQPIIIPIQDVIKNWFGKTAEEIQEKVPGKLITKPAFKAVEVMTFPIVKSFVGTVTVKLYRDVDCPGV
ncbi:MAG: hypothetical protein QME64_04550 [bacterium]|nr:hypothetical protein [bacterium]